MNTLFSLEETSEFFMESFLNLLRKKPIHQISVRELCQKTGYNRSTFYYYFKDVYDLSHQLQNRLIDKIIAEIQMNPLLTDEAFVASLIAVYDHYGETILFLSQQYNFYEAYKEALRPLLFDLANVTEITEDLDMTYEFIMGGILSSLSWYYRQKPKLSSSQFAYRIQEKIAQLAVS